MLRQPVDARAEGGEAVAHYAERFRDAFRDAGESINSVGQELAGWLRTPSDMSSPPRDELVMKILVALRVPGTNVAEIIQVHRKYLVELMQQWTRIKETEAEFDLSLALVVDAELFRLDSVIRWLDSADARIKRAATDPPSPPSPQPTGQVMKLRHRTGGSR